MDQTTNQVSFLVQRLDEAERRAKLLNNEIKRIRQEIVNLKASPALSSGTSSVIGILAAPAAATTAVRNIRSCTVTSATSSTSARVVDLTDSPAKRIRLANNENLEEDLEQENGYVVVYTDGACENNGRPNAKAGIGVWFGDNHNLNISKPVIGKATNNTAEIQACVAALETCLENGIVNVKIKTDSQFTISCMTEWIKTWKKKNWMLATGGPVKNQVDLKKLDALCLKANVLWEHVRGHKGLKGNEEADKLAREGALRYTK